MPEVSEQRPRTYSGSFKRLLRIQTPPLSPNQSNADDIAITSSEEQKSGWLASFFNLSNTAIGAGTLALPFIMHQCGLMLGLLLLVTVGVLSWFSLYFLTVCAKLTNQKTFIGVARATVGKRGEQWASLTLFTMLMGPLSAYINIIGSYSRTIIEEVFDEQVLELWYLSRFMLMTLSAVLFLLPLSLIPSLRVIAYASLLALFAIGYVIVLLPVLYLIAFSSPEWKTPNMNYFINPRLSILSGFSTLGMSVVNHCTVVEIVSDMRDASDRRQNSLTSISSVMIVITYIVVALSGYLLYGDQVTGNILDGAGDGTEVMVARAVMALGVALTYPLLVTPARECLDRTISEWLLKYRIELDQDGDLDRNSSVLNSLAISWDTKSSVRLRFVLETVLVVASSYGIAVAIPNLDKIFALFGALTGSVIVYIMPSVFYVNALLKKGLVNVDRWRLTVTNGDTPNEEHQSLLAGEEVQNIEQYKHVWPLSIVMVYVNIFVGAILLVVGTTYSIVDLFMKNE